jgi:type IX secretion system PorP/SprF family membrane protein
MNKLFLSFKIIVHITLVTMGLLGNLFAQDIHLLQYNSCPQNLNPAQAGLFDGDWRFVGNYRTQWSAIPVPYNTYSISSDTKLGSLLPDLKPKFVKGTPTLGLLINSDKSGDSKLKTTQIYLSFGYIKKLSKDSLHLISFALQPGFTNKNFNASALTFDNQYDGSKYNSSLPTGENFGSTSINYLDIGLGTAYYWQKSSRKKVNAGVSFFHLNTPRQSFFDTKNNKLDVKMNISAIAELPIAPRVGVLPTFLYQRQGKFHETDIGLFGKYYLKPIDGMVTAVSLGMFYRAKDAWVIAANMDYRNFNVGMSYDINTSQLNAATNNKGAFELSVIYIFKKIIPFVAKKRVCPTDM